MKETERLVGSARVNPPKHGVLNHASKANNKRWAVLFVSVASQAMICKGFMQAIIGPTLHFLAINTNSSIDELSSIISGAAVGVAAGAAAFSFVKTKVKDAKPVTSSSIMLFVLGSVSLATPFIRSLILLVFVQMVGGFALGYSETGLVSLYLTLWGEANSRPYIQLNHFMFGVGGFIAPLFAKPFLEKAGQEQNADTTCPGQTTLEPSQLDSNHSESYVDDDNELMGALNPVSWPYFIISIYTFVVAALFCVMASCKLEEKLREHNNEQRESRPEGSAKDIWMFLVSVTMFSFFCMSSYLVYQAYIYSIVVCSDLEMTASEAALLNSLFWGGFGIGRGSAVITSRYFQPSTIIMSDLIGTASATVAMSIWGESSAAVMWIATPVHGFFAATLIPSGVSWSSQVTNMTGKYLFLFLLGGNVGTSIMLRVAGAVFRLHPFFVIRLVSGFCIATSICFALMNFFARRCKVT